MNKTAVASSPCTVTAEYAIKLHRPTPSGGPVTLRGRVRVDAMMASMFGRLVALSRPWQIGYPQQQRVTGEWGGQGGLRVLTDKR
jgi:hypothetical protein